jgi:acyl carrier protein
VTREEIRRAVQEVAREHLGFEGELADGQRLVEDLGLDSIRLLTLAAEVENRFRVTLDAEDEAAIVTAGDLLDRVAAKLAGR